MIATMKAFLIVLTVLGITGCASAPSNGCKSISRAKSVELAREQKRGMLSRSVEADQINFASDDVAPAEGHGFADVVGFRGKDGRTLVALIYEDCYVGWTYQ